MRVVNKLLFFEVGLINKFKKLIVTSEQEIVSKLSKFEDDLGKAVIIFFSKSETSFVNFGGLSVLG
jgi:hypothetical protein